MTSLWQRLSQWFSSPPPDQPCPPPAATAFQELQNLAPRADGEEDLPVRNSAFICREAILGRDQRVAGYEFSLPQRLQSRLKDKREVIRKVYDEALIRNLAAIEVGTLLGDRLAFVELTPLALASPELLRLPPGHLVLALVPPPGTRLNLAELQPRLQALRQRGYRIGVGLESGEQLPPAGELDFLLLNTSSLLPETVAELLARCQQGDQPLQIIACQVESYEVFRVCFDAGCYYFQGSFINQRQSWQQAGHSLNRPLLAMALNQLRQGAETRDLAQTLRQDPVLTFKVLRYINSPVLGMQRQVDSIDQALLVLGRERLYRWLSLLLLHVEKPAYPEWVVMERALVRAAFMEKVWQELGHENGEGAFLAGLLSLLDQLLGEPLATLLQDITLPEEVRLALLEGQGPLAPLLALAALAETSQVEEIQRAGEALGLDQARLNGAMFPALAFAHQVIEASAGA